MHPELRRRRRRPAEWYVYVDLYLNLPYPNWYKEYCVLNLPENEEVWGQKMRDIAALLGAAPGVTPSFMRV